MKAIIKYNVDGVRGNREFELNRSFDLTPLLSLDCIRFIQSLVKEYRHKDFLIEVVLRHEMSALDLFDNFNTELVSMDEKDFKKGVPESVLSGLYDLLVYITNCYSTMPQEFKNRFSEGKCITLRQGLFNALFI